MGLSSLFKRKADKEQKKEIESAPVEEPVEVREDKAEVETKEAPVESAPKEEPEPEKSEKKPAGKKTASNTTSKKTPAKGAEKTSTKTASNTTSKKAAEKEPAKKATSKTAGKKADPKTASEKTPAKGAEKTSAKTTSKSSSKKAPAKKETESEKKESTVSTMPPELKTMNKQLKAFAERSRMEFNSETANAVFTEYMAKVFRDLRYRMLMIKDVNEGLITMLGNTTDDISVKDKIVVKCVYMKKGSVTPLSVEQVQNDGAFYHADETWCITTTDFTDAAVRKARKQEAKVRLFDGKKLYKEFISELEQD